VEPSRIDITEVYYISHMTRRELADFVHDKLTGGESIEELTVKQDKVVVHKVKLKWGEEE